MIRIGLGLAATGWALYQLGATQLGGWTALAGFALLAWRFRAKPPPTRLTHRAMKMCVHPDRGVGGNATPRYVAEHELGHRKVAKSFRSEGVTVGKAQVFGDSGVTWVYIPRKADPNIDIAISVAGRLACGSSSGCGGAIFWADRGSDNWYVQRAIRRGGDLKTGEAMARRALGFWGVSGSDVATLRRDGEI